MKLKSFHWTRRTVVYALIGQAVLLALAVIWRSNGGVLSAHYNVTTTGALPICRRSAGRRIPRRKRRRRS